MSQNGQGSTLFVKIAMEGPENAPIFKIQKVFAEQNEEGEVGQNHFRCTNANCKMSYNVAPIITKMVEVEMPTCLEAISKPVGETKHVEASNQDSQPTSLIAKPEPKLEPNEGIAEPFDFIATMDFCQQSYKDSKGAAVDVDPPLSAVTNRKKKEQKIELRICPVCHDALNCTKNAFNLHLRSRHPTYKRLGRGRGCSVENFNGREFPCIYCEPSVTLAAFKELEDHLKTKHKRSFCCCFCPKAFSSLAQQQTHIESAHEKKIFTCSTCSKNFAWKCNLTTHERKHTGTEKPAGSSKDAT